MNKSHNISNNKKNTQSVERVGAVSTFVRELENRYSMNRIKTPHNDDVFFFRGHSNAEKYKLVPSIFREISWLENEQIMFRQLVSEVPEEFKDHHTTFDILVKMQHYSYPTRLLDVTSNALAALFFACRSDNKPSVDGEVVMFRIPRQQIMYTDSDDVCIISNLAKMSKHSGSPDSVNNRRNRQQTNGINLDELKTLVKQEKFPYSKNIGRNDLQKTLLVYPKQNNKRIIRQSGAFLLFGTGVRPEEPSPVRNEWIVVPKLIINKKYKEKLLEQLEYLGITERTLFPEIDSASNEIKKKYQKMGLKKNGNGENDGS